MRPHAPERVRHLRAEAVNSQAGGESLPLWTRWRQALRWRHRRQALLVRALRKRRELRLTCDRLAAIGDTSILAAMVLRNERARLPSFFAHYRRLGVGHFLIVDNGSDDGSTDYLAAQPDVSLWQTTASYRAARFGLDWLNGLLMRHGHGHWCLVLDADELLIYPHCETRPLPALAEWLEAGGQPSMAAMMLDLYPEGPLGQGSFAPETDPLAALPYFDAGNYTLTLKEDLGALWVQGGMRGRAFFAEAPRRAPTLNKIPFVKWHWRYAWLNSTHSLLPPKLNHVFGGEGQELTSGVLLHTKFLPGIAEKSQEEKVRRQHFADPDRFGAYYDAVIAAPEVHGAFSRRLRGWRQLERLGLLSRGGWV